MTVLRFGRYEACLAVLVLAMAGCQARGPAVKQGEVTLPVGAVRGDKSPTQVVGELEAILRNQGLGTNVLMGEILTDVGTSTPRTVRVRHVLGERLAATGRFELVRGPERSVAPPSREPVEPLGVDAVIAGTVAERGPGPGFDLRIRVLTRTGEEIGTIQVLFREPAAGAVAALAGGRPGPGPVAVVVGAVLGAMPGDEWGIPLPLPVPPDPSKPKGLTGGSGAKPERPAE